MGLNLGLSVVTWNIIKNICYAGYFTTGFCTIHYYKDETIRYDCISLKNFLSDDDFIKIKNWFYKENDFYLDNVYRLDFNGYIFLFKTCPFEDGTMLIGNLFKKEIKFRLDLASLYQEKLMRLFKNDRTRKFST